MRTIVFLLLASLLFRCDPADNLPKAAPSGGSSNPGITLSSNAVSFVATNWHFYVGDVGNQRNPNQYQHTLITGASNTITSKPVIGTGVGGLSSRASSYTLGMTTSAIIDTSSYGYWVYSFLPPTSLRVGRTLNLTAKVRLENVRGKGVSLVLRGDRNKQPLVLFTTTEGKIPLKGTADFTVYSVTLPYSASVDYLLVYLVLLPNTTGTARFTDVSMVIQ